MRRTANQLLETTRSDRGKETSSQRGAASRRLHNIKNTLNSRSSRGEPLEDSEPVDVVMHRLGVQERSRWPRVRRGNGNINHTATVPPRPYVTLHAELNVLTMPHPYNTSDCAMSDPAYAPYGPGQ